MAEACSDGDVNAVRKLLDEGRSVNEHTEEGESLLCLACSAGYYELAQVSRVCNMVFFRVFGANVTRLLEGQPQKCRIISILKLLH